MKVDRREFLKMAGLVSAGVAVVPVVNILTQSGASAANGHLAGKRWAMVVDPSKCEEKCDECQKACHSIHNVPASDGPNDPHTINWIWSEDFHHTFPEQNDHLIAEQMHGTPFMVLCNHCANPACVRACPTRATFKRDDGIVLMDYHRCIGCRFCMAACPYGARSFNWKDPRDNIAKPNPNFPTRSKGVVEKCNFCAERLADGLSPACVEACPNGALIFGDLNDENSSIRQALEQVGKGRFAIQRKPLAGTEPKVYYLV